MWFILGVITGLLIAAVMFCILACLNNSSNPITLQAHKAVRSVGRPRKGYIFEPEDESTLIRKQRIKENAENGKDTPIDELL